MTLCDKCGKAVDVQSHGLLLNAPIPGTYRICDDCGLMLDRFVNMVSRDDHLQLWDD